MVVKHPAAVFSLNGTLFRASVRLTISFQEAMRQIILDEKPYVREMVDRICYETGKDLDLPPKEPDRNGTAEAFAFLKCGKHYGKIGIRHVRVEFNPDDPKKSTATLEFELHINKAENDRNLTVR